jgi:DNA-binding Lrp family transcriptional regulator
MELKKSDYKLLSYLYHHNRESLSKIAKETKLSREQVKYKLNKYLSEGLIRKFVTIFDWSKLGYNYFIILLIKFEKGSSLPRLLKEIEKSKNVVSFGRIYGKYDIFVNFIFKDEAEFNEYISILLGRAGNIIDDYTYIKPFFSKLYPLKFLGSNTIDDYHIISEGRTEIELDDKDKKILKALSKDARIKIVDIASRLRVSGEVVLHRLKRLQKQGIILGSRIQFNMKKLGYFFTLILIDIKNFSKANQEKLKDFVRTSKNINSIIFSFSRPNCFIQIFHKDELVLRETIDKLKKFFSDSQITIEPLLIAEDEKEIDTLPFL